MKFISRNDLGLTGSHQAGYYLPKAEWRVFSPRAPVDGENFKHPVHIRWPDGRATESCVTWYGKGTRSEFRLTRFGRDFPWMDESHLGSLLVLVPLGGAEFQAFVLDTDDEVEAVQVALGIEVVGSWAVYRRDASPPVSAEECIRSRFELFASGREDFPSGDEFSNATAEALDECVSGFREWSLDDALMRCVEEEYVLYRRVESRLCTPLVERGFPTLDAFLTVANSILNRRKSRAGRSLENHVSRLLLRGGVSLEVRPNVQGHPDIVIPSASAYHDQNYPDDQLIILGVKTTLKDRWRQVLDEGKRVPRKHILTLQRGVSAAQLKAMDSANVTLVVPTPIRKEYGKDSPAEILSLEEFAERARRLGGSLLRSRQPDGSSRSGPPSGESLLQ